MSLKNKALIDRLLLLIDELANGKKNKFAEILGVNPANINTWVNKGSAPNAEAFEKLHKNLNVNIHWLLTGEGEKYILSEESATKKEYNRAGAEPGSYQPTGKIKKQREELAKFINEAGSETINAAHILLCKKTIDDIHEQEAGLARKISPDDYGIDRYYVNTEELTPENLGRILKEGLKIEKCNRVKIDIKTVMQNILKKESWYTEINDETTSEQLISCYFEYARRIENTETTMAMVPLLRKHATLIEKRYQERTGKDIKNVMRESKKCGT